MGGEPQSHPPTPLADNGTPGARANHTDLTRRDFLRLTSLVAASTMVAACGAPGISTQAPAPTVETKHPVEIRRIPANETATALPAEAPTEPPTTTREAPPGQVRQLPRKDTLILTFTGGDVGIGNPYAPGYVYQRGHAALMEPLYFYSAFATEPTIPWLAESHTYSPDFKDVTIQLRHGVEWSDGTPFTSKDVAYTINMLRQNQSLTYAAEMRKWVQEATALDELTVTITFTQPAPRFVFDFLSSKFDTGIYLLPEHVFKEIDDVTAFLFYDPAKGWPLTTGPYRIVEWTPQVEFIDLRRDWWAAKTGFAPLPEIERIVIVPRTNDSGEAQAIILNEIDTAFSVPPQLMVTILKQNPKLITHSGREKPYGYIDWWTQALWFNNETAPFDDVEVRRAINHTINRDQIVEFGQDGAGTISVLPFPQFPVLEKYFDAARPLLKKYPVNDFQPAKTDEIMTRKGYTRDGDDLWVDADGTRIDTTIYGFDFMADYGAVLAEQLRTGGFDASFQAPSDAYTRMDTGTASLFLYGRPNAIADVFPSMDLLHEKYYRPTNEGGGISTRWQNDEYSSIMDEMSLFEVGDDRAMPLYRRALEIYLREMPDIPIIQFYQRSVYNTTYWANWPTAANSYVNGAFWHQTFPLMLHKLKKVT